MNTTVASVAFPVAIAGVYDYRIPPHCAGEIHIGTPVLVTLRSRRMWGVVVELKGSSPYPDLKPLLEVKAGGGGHPDDSLIRLYRWIASYYCCPLGSVFKPFVRKKLVEASPRTISVYRRTSSPLPEGLSGRRREAAERIAQQPTPLTLRELRNRLEVGEHLVRALVAQGVLAASRRPVQRDETESRYESAPQSIALTNEQRQAVARIRSWCDNPARPVLLHGITGSGKTHVYIELARHVLARGRGVIVLVPEIALTPQTIRRFREALGDVLAIIHSHMSDTQRRENLDRLVSGEKRMVIGVRSAILAPVTNPGLIIVDEEHDGSYKQCDPEPRYQARDVAIMRGRFQNACVVLGSATPSLESTHNARTGKFELIRIESRFGEALLPRVKIVDMNDEHAHNNWGILSRYLDGRIEETLHHRRQIILLLNRRGFSTFLLCPECGNIHTCPNCSVNLTYHRSDTSLKCHQCGYRMSAPPNCSKCGGATLKYKGTGIQKAEEALRERFPCARLLRMDQDTTRRKGAHATILDAFAAGEADILLGTQMVSKGLNFPGVRLVGVLQADVGLHLPDFRAAEKTFQLLTQVAGRAGRNDAEGEVVIQTYFPADPAIQSAQVHDYEGFVQQEFPARKELRYPPFSRLARVLVTAGSEETARTLAHAAAQAVRGCAASGIELLGPVPAPLARIKSAYRYTLLLKSPSNRSLHTALNAVAKVQGRGAANGKVVIDVDPLSML